MTEFTCFPPVGAEFALISDRGNFRQAENLCLDNDSTLASVRSLEEFVFIRDEVPNTQAVDSFWIGTLNKFCVAFYSSLFRNRVRRR